MGNESGYKPHFCAQAEKLCKLGATNVELGEFFGITKETIRVWSNQFPAFKEAIRAGKELADAEVASKLYSRAMGYKHIAFKMFKDKDSDRVITKRYVEHYPPDTTACIFWLKNRRPDLWRDRHELTGKDGKDLPNAAPDVMEVARSLLFILTAADNQAKAAIDKARTPA